MIIQIENIPGLLLTENQAAIVAQVIMRACKFPKTLDSIAMAINTCPILAGNAWAYKGGSHIAVHELTASLTPTEPRIALITLPVA